MKVTIQSIYDHYEIVPHLQLHMLRVAGVAMLICDHCNLEIDTPAITSAALLHDMGNLIKFDFSIMPEVFEEKGIEYRQTKQKNWIWKYGKDAHDANVSIAQEIWVSSYIINIMDYIWTHQATTCTVLDNAEYIITDYSDMRVSPHTITSVKKRMEEVRSRYKTRASRWTEEGHFQELLKNIKKEEKELFTYCSISSEDINDDSVTPLIAELRNFPIHTSWT